MTALKTANLALAFLLEVVGLAAAAYWGYQTAGASLKVPVAVGAALVLGVAWGLVAAPRSVVRVRLGVKALVAPALLLLCAAGLAVAGLGVPGAIFAMLIVVNATLSAAWKQRAS